MPTPLDHAVVLLITVVLPVHDLLFWYPRLVRAAAARVRSARHRAYFQSLTAEWVLLAVTAGSWALQGRAWGLLGIRVPSLGLGFLVACALAGAFAVFVGRQRVNLVRETDEDARAEVIAHLEPLRPLLPHTRRELLHFSAVSVTAGICEEVLFRGFVIWYLRELVPVIPAVLVASLLFGMAHAYQGTRGIGQTALVGLGMAILYVVSGSLWVPMFLHAFIDLNSGFLAYAYLRSETGPAFS
jgi:membrane protease YdiL (CAAX protease family)